MGKKGKKGANKLAKMSEEERLRYLQSRADIEEENRRRKQQLIAIFMKNKLKREDAFTRLNVAKINQEWRTILRQLKCDDLRLEIRCAQELCTVSIDRKNQIIQRLLTDLENAEELYSKNLQSHTQNVQKLIGIHDQRLKFWCDFYAREKEILLGEFRKGIDAENISFEQSKCELECVYYALDEEMIIEQKKSQKKNQKILDDFQNMMTIRLEYVTNSREGVMESLWREFQMVLSNYSAYTKEFYEDYLELRRRDEIETKISEGHYQEIAKCTDLIADLRLEINSKKKRHEMNVAHLQAVKRELQEEYGQLKRELVRVQAIDKTKIRELVTCADRAKKVLERQKAKVTSLIQLATICRKYETDTQKFILIPKNQVENALTVDAKQDFPVATYSNLEQLGQFWDRYNKVRLDCACLAEERSGLMAENNQLKIRLRKYLVDVSMQSSTGNNELRLGHRPKSMTIQKVQCRSANDNRASILTGSKLLHRTRPVTCIEGNLSVAIRSKRMLDRLGSPNQ